MSDYTAPVRDMRFVLEHLAGLPELAELEAFSHADADMVGSLLEEAGRFCSQAVAPTNREGDEHGAQLTADGEVVLPDSFRRVYDQYVEAGWAALSQPPEYGGGGFPLVVASAFKEMLNAANLSFSLGPLLTTGAVYAMSHHADDELKNTYLPRMVTGEWAGTMNLTEPQAGSDVGAATTKAVPQGDGTYRITGQKIYITFGEHQLTDQIVHLVLARLPDAPPGTKGISLFVVPKYLVEDDGSLGERNDVTCISIEHKLGIHASPTCTMAYGEQGDGAVGYLVGRENEGMREMFTMMNDARLGVGQQGVAIAERAYQQAVAYAKERRQGRAPGAEPGEQSPIIAHADVRRMLMTMKACIEAARALTFVNAAALDRAAAHPDEDVREHNQKLADLYTPLSKAWGTDLGVELTSLAIQVHGGMGYVEETGVAQHYRDARIAPIYEGTNGIQAIDLVGRKLPYDGGAFVKGFVEDLRASADSLEGDALASIRERLVEGVDVLAEATEWVFEHREDVQDVFAGATPYLRLMATVVGAELMARAAGAAQEQLDAGASGADEDFYRSKVVTARFFAEQVLPSVHGLKAQVTATARDLYALDEDQYATA
jgi:alkylation response protein AidB-like acyl-CoA dehydrogenase